MSDLIIYQEGGNPAAILYPCECDLSLLEIGRKDVPQGAPFWIVGRPEVESLHAQYGDARDAWEITEQSIGRVPDGHGGGK